MRNAECPKGLPDGRGVRNVSVGVVALVVLLCSPLAGQTSLSIYTDGRVVVRKTLSQALTQGRNSVTLKIEGLDPATLFSPDSLVTVASATVRFPSTIQDALARAVGQTLAFAREKDTVRATVVRADPPQYRLADGRLVLEQPGQPLFPAGLVRTEPEASLVVDAARARPKTELAFVGQGVTWEAVYQVVLGARQAAVSGAATVTSQALRADSAEAQLVAGTVRRTRQPAPATDLAQRQSAIAALAVGGDMAGAPEAVGETHVYPLPGRLTIEPGVPVTTALFPRSSATYTQEFVVPGVLPWRGYFGGIGGDPLPAPVQVWYTVTRGRGTPFGDRPLPAGTVQLYQPDSAGRVQLVGEAAIGHTPAGKDLRVQSGDAFDVTAERVQTDFNQEQIPPARRGLPATARINASLRVRLTNAKPTAVTVDVREVHQGEWKVTASSAPAEKLSSSEVRFRVTVPAGGEAVLTYSVQLDS